MIIGHNTLVALCVCSYLTDNFGGLNFKKQLFASDENFPAIKKLIYDLPNFVQLLQRPAHEGKQTA